ncbi:LCP family protein [Actinomadura rubrisoli]|uniref:LytR family transcriptional regulator n=1 Tax=Actinomadura rubrisoli TaxID=2530368 RepID=A0A4R5A7Q3_9ACTN|nr:LCP family protein [Actinomadura rubrisoli]TDD66674.1 LytR family transcriptional regulator [Actinomadura rubrisoli]
MDDLKMLRGLGRELEHEPPGSLVRQRQRLVDAARGRPRKVRLPSRWALVGMVAVVTAALIVVPAVLLRKGDLRPVDQPNPFAAGSGKMLNVLIMGSDARSRGGPARSDTLVLVHLPADRKHVRAVSVPRDSLVRIPACRTAEGKLVSGGTGPINAAFTLGGAPCTQRTIESLTGVRIDSTVTIDFGGFKKMVDALGGVEVTLPKAVTDKRTGLSLPAGRQRLDGTRALAYVRVRHGLGDGSDLSRVERQQRFMASLLRQAKSQQLRNPVRFVRFLAAAAGSVTTHPRLDVPALEAIARSLEKTGADAVTFSTVPVSPSPHDPNRLAWDRDAAAALFAQFKAEN